jgi:hypothetical protein
MPDMNKERGRSSEVERQLPKLNVVGSIPIARSNISRPANPNLQALATSCSARATAWMHGSVIRLADGVSTRLLQRSRSMRHRRLWARRAVSYMVEADGNGRARVRRRMPAGAHRVWGESMDARAEGSQADAAPSRLGWALVGGAVVCLTAAGLLLWSRTGEAVFSDMVLAALAWCF